MDDDDLRELKLSQSQHYPVLHFVTSLDSVEQPSAVKQQQQERPRAESPQAYKRESIGLRFDEQQNRKPSLGGTLRRQHGASCSVTDSLKPPGFSNRVKEFQITHNQPSVSMDSLGLRKAALKTAFGREFSSSSAFSASSSTSYYSDQRETQGGSSLDYLLQKESSGIMDVSISYNQASCSFHEDNLLPDEEDRRRLPSLPLGPGAFQMQGTKGVRSHEGVLTTPLSSEAQRKLARQQDPSSCTAASTAASSIDRTNSSLDDNELLTSQELTVFLSDQTSFYSRCSTHISEKSQYSRAIPGMRRAFIIVLVVIIVMGGAVAGIYLSIGQRDKINTDKNNEVGKVGKEITSDPVSFIRQILDDCEANETAVMDDFLLDAVTVDRMDRLVVELGLNNKTSSNLTLSPSTFCSAETLAILGIAAIQGDQPTSHSELLHRYILSVFFLSTRGLDWINSEGWLQSSHWCDWFGVVCNDDGKNDTLVLGLNLIQNDLNGSIPEILFSIKSLESLNLGGNSNLGGSIPDSISRLSRLEVIDLGATGLVGSLPPQLLRLSTLRHLNLQKSFGIDPLSFTDFRNFVDLKILYLSSGHVPERTISSDMFVGLENLEELIISGGGNLGGQLPSLVESSSVLRVVDLGPGTLTGTIGASMFEGSKAWQEIILAGNDIGGSIPTEIGNLKNLFAFHINSNRLRGTIPTELGLCTSMEQINLSQNHFVGRIPSEMGNLSVLRDVDIRNNKFSGTLPLDLTRLSGLSFLDIGDNDSLSGTIPSTLCTVAPLLKIDFECSYQECDMELIRSCISLGRCCNYGDVG